MSNNDAESLIRATERTLSPQYLDSYNTRPLTDLVRWRPPPGPQLAAIQATWDSAATMMVDKTRVIELIRDKLKAWGHNNAPGCPCCATAQGLIEALEVTYPEPRVVDEVIVTGPKS